MRKTKYTIEKHTITEWIVMGQVEGTCLRKPIARCNTEETALTIKRLSEQAESKDAKHETGE